jgi:hypothetical protein
MTRLQRLSVAPPGVCVKNRFSLCNLSELCVTAVNLPETAAHRRGAENAENAQSFFCDRVLQQEKNQKPFLQLVTSFL